MEKASGKLGWLRCCIKCPVVIMRMQKLEATGCCGKELKKGLKAARAA